MVIRGRPHIMLLVNLKFIRTSPKSTEVSHQWGQTYTFDKMWIIDRVANLGKMIER